jgi:hypothetical protein
VKEGRERGTGRRVLGRQKLLRHIRWRIRARPSGATLLPSWRPREGAAGVAALPRHRMWRDRVVLPRLPWRRDQKGHAAQIKVGAGYF